MNTKIQGFSNVETLIVQRTIANDREQERCWRNLAQRTYDNARIYATRDETNIDFFKREFADLLREKHFRDFESVHHRGTVQSELLHESLSRVNWREIAETYIEDIEQSTTDAVARLKGARSKRLAITQKRGQTHEHTTRSSMALHT